jgi:TPR repeat protein
MMRTTLLAVLIAIATITAGAQTLDEDDRPDPDVAQAGLAWLIGDHGKALRHFQAAAARGNAHGQYNLAMMLLLGEGTAAQPRQAVAWLRKAARNGLARAQYEFAELHFEGRHVPRSLSQAAWWHGKAARQGWLESQLKLADMHMRGSGVRRDRREALRWYVLAAARGNAYARDKALELGRRFDDI